MEFFLAKKTGTNSKTILCSNVEGKRKFLQDNDLRINNLYRIIYFYDVRKILELDPKFYVFENKILRDHDNDRNLEYFATIEIRLD